MKIKALEAVVVFVIIIALAGSLYWRTANADIKSRMEQDAKSLVNSLTYVKDSRTGLCFAVFHAYRNSAITTVPCTKISIFKQ